MRITTSGRSKRYALYSGGELVSSGELSGTDYLATSLDVVANEDDNAFLNSVTVDGLPELPEAGTWLEAGDVYADGNRAVLVRQSHTRTEHAVDDVVPTLFLMHRENVDGIEWIAGENVTVGARRVYNGVLYHCIQAHVTQSDWTPPQTPTLWVGVVEAGDGWSAGADYDVGHVVIYDGDEYECVQAHSSLPGWEPPNVPALWSLVQEPTDEWQAGVWYDIGDVVLYDGTEYECIQAHTAQVGWEPPRVPALWQAV